MSRFAAELLCPNSSTIVPFPGMIFATFAAELPGSTSHELRGIWAEPFSTALSLSKTIEWALFVFDRDFRKIYIIRNM